MAGVKGRSGRSVGIKKILKSCEKLIEDRADEIITAYIDKAIQGDSACLINLADRLMGKSPNQLDVRLPGMLDADQVAMIYKKAYEDFQAQGVKQIPSPVKGDKQ